MGCFDYTCQCQKRRLSTCSHTGGQHQEANVIIEVPLNDGTNVHIKGFYEEYGYVSVELDNKEYRFYLKEFEEYFEGWIEDDSEKERSTYFLATKCWTYGEEYDPDFDQEECGCCEEDKHQRYCYRGGYDDIDELTQKIVDKCIRIDKDMKFPTDKERYENEIAQLEEATKENKKELNNLKNLFKLRIHSI